MRTCRYCNRQLPDEAFPIKSHRTHARYKVCRECRAVGHSCIEKQKPKPRKVMTPEERKIHRLEYFRAYREKHRQKLTEQSLESQRRRIAGEPKRKPGPKPKQPPKPETRICVVCGRERPVADFYARDGRRTNSQTCIDCRPEPRPKAAPQPPQPKPQPKEKGCKLCCARYPCFDGIDNFETDFSLTCRNFTPKF